MTGVLRRIVIHGIVTAAILAAVGLLMTSLLMTWQWPATSERIVEGGIGRSEPDVDAAWVDTVRWRLPAFMALWGFVFVAVGEGVLGLLRSRRTPPAASPPAEESPTDPERLLEELLRQAEARQEVRPDLPEAEQQPAPVAGESAGGPAESNPSPLRDQPPEQAPAR